jgi:hypothetical protein
LRCSGEEMCDRRTARASSLLLSRNSSR